MENAIFLGLSIGIMLFASLMLYLAFRLSKTSSNTHKEAISFYREALKKYEASIKNNADAKVILSDVERKQTQTNAGKDVKINIVTTDEVPDEIKDIFKTMHRVEDMTSEQMDADMIKEMKALKYDDLIDFLEQGEISDVKKLRRICAEHNENELISVIDGYLKNKN